MQLSLGLGDGIRVYLMPKDKEGEGHWGTFRAAQLYMYKRTPMTLRHLKYLGKTHQAGSQPLFLPTSTLVELTFLLSLMQAVLY